MTASIPLHKGNSQAIVYQSRYAPSRCEPRLSGEKALHGRPALPLNTPAQRTPRTACRLAAVCTCMTVRLHACSPDTPGTPSPFAIVMRHALRAMHHRFAPRGIGLRYAHAMEAAVACRCMRLPALQLKTLQHLLGHAYARQAHVHGFLFQHAVRFFFGDAHMLNQQALGAVDNLQLLVLLLELLIFAFV